MATDGIGKTTPPPVPMLYDAKPPAGPTVGAGGLTATGGLPDALPGAPSGTPGETEALRDPAGQALQLEELVQKYLTNARDPSALARALVELAAFQRANAVEARAAARENAKSALLEAAGKSFDAADKTKSAAVKQLAAGMLGAAASAGFGALSLNLTARPGNATGAVKANEVDVRLDADLTSLKNQAAPLQDVKVKKDAVLAELTQAGPAPTGQAKPQALKELDAEISVTKAKIDERVEVRDNTNRQVAAGRAQAYAQVGGATSGAVSTPLTFLAKGDEADAQIDQAEGQIDQANAQDIQTQQDQEKKIQEDFTALIQAVIQFLKQQQDAEIERMAIIGRMGG
ncbi:MAG: hypothetical protein AAF318_01370 [Pseudomonadota bacterium]